MASESQKKEFAAARKELIERMDRMRTFDTSSPTTGPKDSSSSDQNVLNRLREKFADLFLVKDVNQRNYDICYCLANGVCAAEEKKLVSCFVKADEAGADVSESCNEEIGEMKTCINKCLYKLLEKKMDFLRLISDIPHYYES